MSPCVSSDILIGSSHSNLDFSHELFQVEVSTRSSAGSGQRRQQLTGLNGEYWSPVESDEKRRLRQKRQIVASDQNVDKAKRLVSSLSYNTGSIIYLVELTLVSIAV